MNKLTLALVLGTGVSLSMAVTTSAVANPMEADKPLPTVPQNQTLPTTEMTAATFNSLFKPIEGLGVLENSYQLLGDSVSGTVRSQVFEGYGAAVGKYAYAYQVSVASPTTGGTAGAGHVDSLSYRFNDTPEMTSFVSTKGVPQDVYGYTVSGGAIGGLLGPAKDGELLQKPASLSWISNKVNGALRVHFVDPDTKTPPLDAGSTSAALVVISDAPLPEPSAPKTEFVNLQSDRPTTNLTAVYAASGGNIDAVPIPEPSTVLAWTGMIGALALVRRVRKNRPTA